MTQIVYVDVLIGVNLIVNYFLLLACAKFLAVPFKRARLFAAASLGALYSLSILLPEWNAFLSILIKLLMSASIVLTAFGRHGLKALIRQTAAFFIINFAFAGLMLVLWYLLAPQGMLIRNSVVYFDISPLMLILLTAVCYVLITFVNRITGRQMPREMLCRMTAEYGGRSCSCVARVDTGNSLREPFSGDPVAVIHEAAVAAILPPKDSLNFRLVPFEAISGTGVLRAFRPDRLIIRYGDRLIDTSKVYIAVSKTKFGEFDALINPELLQKTSG